jgi:hypothetical protein
MNIRVRKNLSFVSRGPVGLPAPRVLAADSTFNGVYLRPNSGSDGSVPDPGPYCNSPDIWIAGTDPIPRYQTALATAQSYASSSSNNIYSGQNNIIYVRGMNGATAAETKNVTLYYSPSGVIQQPSKWQNNVILTDQGGRTGNIVGLAPATIGVCDATFLWQNSPPPPPGSDHYCLFAQFNDANNSNPFPNVETALDMGALIMNNLGWGWRNTSMIAADAQFSYSEPLTIPSDYPSTQAYSILIAPTGFVGWDAEFYCSQTDAKGHKIALARTKVTQDGVLLGVDQAILDPGFTGQMTVNMYSPNNQGPAPGSTVSLSCNYVAKGSALLEAIERGLVDWGFMQRLRRSCPELHLGIGPSAWIVQGSYSGTALAAPSRS